MRRKMVLVGTSMTLTRGLILFSLALVACSEAPGGEEQSELLIPESTLKTSATSAPQTLTETLSEVGDVVGATDSEVFEPMVLVEVRGEVLVDGEILNSGQTIPPGAEIEVKQGSAILKIPKIGDVKLLPKSRVYARSRARLFLLAGRLWAKIIKAEDQDFAVETDNAVAGVRGTEFLVSAEAEDTEVSVLEGEVAVGARSYGTATKKNRPVSVLPGLRLRVRKTKVQKLQKYQAKVDLKRWQELNSIPENRGALRDLALTVANPALRNRFEDSPQKLREALALRRKVVRKGLQKKNQSPEARRLWIRKSLQDEELRLTKAFNVSKAELKAGAALKAKRRVKLNQWKAYHRKSTTRPERPQPRGSAPNIPPKVLRPPQSKPLRPKRPGPAPRPVPELKERQKKLEKRKDVGKHIGPAKRGVKKKKGFKKAGERAVERRPSR